MSRFERRGYGTCRSPELSSKAYRTPLPFCALALLVCLALTVFVSAQDVNVHIQPRPADAVKPAASTDPAVTTAEALLKNHTKPVLVDVILVLANVTATDHWNRNV